MKKALSVMFAFMLLASALSAGATGQNDKQAPTLTEVRVCPIEGGPVKGEGAGSEIVGKYKVYFCCPDCQPKFDKLSKAEKEKKVTVALKKQQDKKKH